MKNKIKFIERVDFYLDQKLSEEEQKAFEAECNNDPEARKCFEEHRYLRQQFALKKKYTEAKGFIEQGSKNWKTKQSARQNYIWKAIAIAASLALLLSITALWQTNRYISSQQSNNFIELRREINDIKRSQKDLKDVVQTNTPSSNTQQFGGTGFALSTNGYLATNSHVIAGADSVHIITSDKKSYKAKLVFQDAKYDLAILKIVDSTFCIPPLPFELGDTAYLGENIYTLGYPRNEIVYGKGYISAASGFKGDSSSYQLSLSVSPGSSGGPVIDKNGKILGIITGKKSATDNIAFAIKSSYLLKIRDSIPKDLPEPIIQSNHYTLEHLNRIDQIEKLKKYVYLVKAFK